MSNKSATQDDGLIVVSVVLATAILIAVGIGMAG